MGASPFLKRFGTGWVLRRLVILTLVVMGPSALAQPGWVDSLSDSLARIDAKYPGELGVYVKNMTTGESYGLRENEFWYLASTVKVPVAIAVMESVDRGELSLDTQITLLRTDFVDGAGATNWHSPGDRVSVRYLMEQMLKHSDNTATDVLIRTVGLDAVNALVRREVPTGVGDITTLSDVRRHAYSHFHQQAYSLTSSDLFTLKKARGGQARMAALAEVLDLERQDFQVHTLKAAFDAYYASHLNAGQLSAFARVFEALVDGRVLSEPSRAYVLDILANIETGEHRIKASLPGNVRFAHKTGTQYGRACNIGVATAVDVHPHQNVVIAACGRGVQNLAASEAALRAVGKAVADSGVFAAGQ